MLRSNECPADECCLAANVQARKPIVNVFDDQDNNRSGVMRVYAKTALFRRAQQPCYAGNVAPRVSALVNA
jgi:hypothetical protein